MLLYQVQRLLMKLLLGIQNKRLSHSLYRLSSWCSFDGDTWWHHPLKQQSIAFTSPTFPFESKRLHSRTVCFFNSIDRFHMIFSMLKHHLRPFHHISTWKGLVNHVNSPCHWVVAVPHDHEIDSDPGTLDSTPCQPTLRWSVGHGWNQRETRKDATVLVTFLKVYPLEILHPSFMGFWCHQSINIARTLFWHKDILPKRSLSDPFRSFIA